MDPVRRRWRSSLYRQVVAVALAAAPGLMVTLAVLVAVEATLAAGVAVSIGRVVGRLPEAVAAGPGSPAADAAFRSIGLVAVLMVVQQLAAAGELVVAGTLARRSEGSVRRRVMSAAMAPEGTAHLTDPAIRTAIEGATTFGNGRAGPMMSVEALVPMWSSLLSGLALAVLIVGYRWWLGVGVAGVWLYARAVRRLDNLAQAEMLRSDDFGTRRQGYFRQLTLTPDAAKEIRVFGLGGWLVDRFHSQWVDTVESMWRIRRGQRPALGLPIVVLFVVNAVAFGLIARDAWLGNLPLEELVIVLQAMVGISAMAEPGVRNPVDGGFVLGARSLARVPSLEALTGTARPRSTASPLPPIGDISIRDLCVGYPGRSDRVLDRLTLDVPASRSLAVVGHNGAGKTTLVKTICGLLIPSNGTIEVAGRALGAIDRGAWRASIAVVFQDFLRLQYSIRDNVCCVANGREVPQSALDAIAERVGLDEVLARLPHGWDTVATRQQDGGVDLSGGEWQRVALARALCAVQAGASLLIMDEPTASLDVRAEAAFYDRFLDLTAGVSTIVISHRFSTVRRADAICVLEHGRVIELGTHQTLLAQGGEYARLFRLQASAYDPTPAGDVDE